LLVLGDPSTDFTDSEKRAIILSRNAVNGNQTVGSGVCYAGEVRDRLVNRKGISDYDLVWRSYDTKRSGIVYTRLCNTNPQLSLTYSALDGQNKDIMKKGVFLLSKKDNI
jgi:hypothetical protein